MIATPQLILKKRGEEWYIADYRKPETILPHVRDKASLIKALEYFSHPFIKMRLPDSRVARRHYLEATRPALRWYCREFGVEVPAWLVGNAHFDDIDAATHEDLFGPEPLHVREFEPWKRPIPSRPPPQAQKGAASDSEALEKALEEIEAFLKPTARKRRRTRRREAR